MGQTAVIDNESLSGYTTAASLQKDEEEALILELEYSRDEYK